MKREAFPQQDETRNLGERGSWLREEKENEEEK
jgi:hypothetical protein